MSRAVVGSGMVTIPLPLSVAVPGPLPSVTVFPGDEVVRLIAAVPELPITLNTRVAARKLPVFAVPLLRSADT